MPSRVSAVSTDSVDPASRLAYWEDYNSRELVGFRCSTYRDDGLRAKEKNLDLGGPRLASIEGNPHVVDRSVQQVKTSPTDSIFVTVLTKGTAFFHHPRGLLTLKAGDAIVYPSGSLHQVLPVTRGERVASFLWTQSMVRDDAKRALLFELDTNIQKLRAAHGETEAVIGITGHYHNLLRMWAEM